MDTIDFILVASISILYLFMLVDNMKINELYNIIEKLKEKLIKDEI